ncbi:MAG: OmpH family outer membrane protein [Puniceicoccales bacterium]|nr:OmpH family outer membrane protein [Puniceicoccales bacterium]
MVACSLALVACGKNCTQSKIVTVDMAKVYNKYARAERSKEQFQEAVEKAQGEMRAMLDEGVKMAKELQELREKMDNPSLSETARTKFRKQADEVTEEIRKKEVEVNSFRQQTDRELMERREKLVTKHIEEIRTAAKSVAERRKVDLVLNTSGIEVIHAKSSMDITKDVIEEVNKGK